MDKELMENLRHFNIPNDCGIDFSQLTKTINRYDQEEEILHLPHKKIWFRFLYPNGKMTAAITKETEDYIIAEAKIYRHCTDAEHCFIGEGTSVVIFQNVFPEKPLTFLERYAAAVPLAKSLATSKALNDAGFGLQFLGGMDDTDGYLGEIVAETEKNGFHAADACEEEDTKPIEQEDPKTEPKGLQKNKVAKKQEISAAQEKTAENKGEALDELPFDQTEYRPEQPDLTIEEARNYVVCYGKLAENSKKPVTLGEIEQNPQHLTWLYANAPDNEIKKAIKVLVDSMNADRKEQTLEIFKKFNITI